MFQLLRPNPDLPNLSCAIPLLIALPFWGHGILEREFATSFRGQRLRESNMRLNCSYNIIYSTGEDEKDNGMEMENDFEGDMFDVPKGEEKDEGNDDDAEEKEELDREMGDLGDDADVVDMKLWDEDDEDDGDGKEQGEQKFESG